MNEIILVGEKAKKKMSQSTMGSGRMQDLLNKFCVIYFLRKKHLSYDLTWKEKYSIRRGEKGQRILECNEPGMLEEWWGWSLVNCVR